jgi:hypothetical protein
VARVDLEGLLVELLGLVVVARKVVRCRLSVESLCALALAACARALISVFADISNSLLSKLANRLCLRRSACNKARMQTRLDGKRLLG